jgi:DNA-binding transcriptional LysR family regulator
MELRQLRYFAALARHRHFTRAARSLSVAQPALSQQIRRLEVELGVPLVERHHRPITLTPAGEALLARAQRVLSEVDAAHADVAKLKGVERGRVCIGAVAGLSPFDLAAALSTFNVAHPGIELVLREETAAEMLRQLETHELDLAFLNLLDAATVPPFEHVPLAAEELRVVVSLQHGLAERTQVDLCELTGERLVAFRSGSALRQLADAALQRVGAEPHVIFETSDLLLARTLIANGLGCALLPQSIEHLPGPPIKTLPVDPVVFRTVGLVRLKDGPVQPAARLLWNHFLDVAGRLPSLP